MIRRSLSAALVAAALMLPARAQAQYAHTLKLAASEVNDSLRVMRELEARVKADPRDAAAWHRLGMVSWALTEWAKTQRSRAQVDPTRTGRQADTALRLAAALAPNKPEYRVAAGRYLLASGAAMTRAAAFQQFDQAVKDGRANGADPLALADAAVELGYGHWRRYDGLVNRRLTTAPGAAIRQISEALQPQAGTGGAEGRGGDETGADPQLTLKAVRERIETSTTPLPPNVTGDGDYVEAEKLFREAVTAAPQHPRAFRAFAMVLAERNRWAELRENAEQQLARVPWDPYAWMVLGLASYRQGDTKVAAAAYDSAFTFLAPAEAQRLDRLERVMRPTDSTRMGAASQAQRNATGQLYWLYADPLWSRDGNETRLEFLARTTFAELRWTVWDLDVRGADTDRGDVYIRYGPPDLIAAFGSTSAYVSEVSQVWVYDSGLLFSFIGATAFGTARTGVDDKFMVERMAEAMPVRWDNLASITVDSLPTQPLRFRAGGDSVDVVITAQAPVDAILASRPTPGGTVRADWWLLQDATRIVERDSVPTLTGEARVFTGRVVPGSYVSRLEASTDLGLRAARSAIPLVITTTGPDAFPTRGFGLSDLLLATAVEPRGAPRSWRDFAVTPAFGALSSEGTLGLVWEMYELGARDGAANYTFSLTIKRERGVAGRIAARALGAIAGAARIDTREDEVTVSFDRTVPHAATLADHLALSLAGTPAGSYTLTLRITDRVSNRSTERSRSLTIR
jgi:GWxTD domain-containing protein